MDKYIGSIITNQRTDTRNSDADAIPDSDFLRFNQYAQDRLFGLITLSYNWVFEEVIEIDIVAGQNTYEINDNLAFGTRITNVEYSHSGLAKDYRPLQVTADRYVSDDSSSRPYCYRRRHGKIVVEGTPSQSVGKLRATYERALDRLALRAGQINGTPSGTTIDLTTSGNLPTAENEALFTAGEYICVSAANGEPLLYNAVISSYDAPTDVLTFVANVDTYLVPGKTLSNLANQFITIGKYTSTHSKLTNEAEGYFIEYVNRKVHNIDSSDQFAETDKILKEIKDMVVASYKMPDKARKQFPISSKDIWI